MKNINENIKNVMKEYIYYCHKHVGIISIAMLQFSAVYKHIPY